ncbi:hypothetical protein PVAND_007524 [Polypedilum vanderplanki]|uniref:Uncharacterized protein n=1 Tax=Polypedilum vanderplanki TaxID=319348 RepID=A0A9J6C6X5_POLVA|nr:hypothetical protein PVAND_007524 [Polypedilum vanderplanki]
MKFLILLTIFEIFKVTKSFEIDCTYGMSIRQSLNSVYACTATNFPTTSDIAVTSVIGIHLDGESNNDVAMLKIQGNHILSFIPRNFSNFFSNIKSIGIYNTAITILFGDEFEEFPKLEWLAFYENNLTIISSEFFEKTPKVAYIWFTENMIEKVGYDLFTPLNVTQLQHVNFRGNRCIDQGITNGNQASIISLINEILQKCSFDHEISSLMSTTSLAPEMTSSSTISTNPTATNENSFCTYEKIEDFVCALKDSLSKVQENLATEIERVEKIEKTLNATKEELSTSKLKTNELQNDLTKANGKIDKFENIQLKLKEEIELMMSDFEERLKNIENEISKANYYVSTLALLICCIFALQFL